MNYSKIKEILTSKGLSIPQLSEKIGMSKAGLYLAIDKKSLTIDILEKIALALEVPITVFFDIELPQDYKNKIADLEKRIQESEEKSQTRQTIINLVFQSLKQITSKHELLMKFAGEMESSNDGHNPDLEKFLNETIASLNEMQGSLYEWAVYINQPGYKRLILATQDSLLGKENEANSDPIKQTSQEKKSGSAKPSKK